MDTDPKKGEPKVDLAHDFLLSYHTISEIYSVPIRYDTIRYFNVRSKADISQLNLPHGTDN